MLVMTMWLLLLLLLLPLLISDYLLEFHGTPARDLDMSHRRRCQPTGGERMSRFPQGATPASPVADGDLALETRASRASPLQARPSQRHKRSL
ncbi:MAG: hypothetical protein AVDCRST_MAG93-10073 [uncultured Chloroflexia bacterium]|uniref:Uncharacterized protein n=1 Tax=uncultured Chloroflexia bacterium TaxID=1672391 RepID=A0A6J4NUE8_9CHLR|nr:MAG: hypothetical protein AVDCRST_MAG93-10073 [uncultured Chloroflexia bacterium]